MRPNIKNLIFLLLSIIVIIAAVSLVISGGALLAKDSHLRSRGVTGTATVISANSNTGHLLVAITHGQRSYRADLSWESGSMPTVGRQVTITYDPQDPKIVRQPSSTVWRTTGWFMVIPGAIALLVGLLLLVLGIRGLVRS